LYHSKPAPHSSATICYQYPTSARFSLRRREIDPAWRVIRLLKACKLAKVRQLPIARAAA
jgi:fatty-acid desaturase